jgi:glutaredoxin
MSSPKIILYTNRLCPWAHRAHIALKEIGLDYEEVTIDLSTPREPWYLEINPVSDSALPTLTLSSIHLHYILRIIHCELYTNILNSVASSPPFPTMET